MGLNLDRHLDLKRLITKYSTSGPRYTSYPTAPQWSESTGVDAYRGKLSSGFLGADKTLGLYVHLPFCESLCYYCGCNIQITHDKSRSGSYVDSVIREIRTVAKLLGEKRTLTQISWGGGTPTFLTLDEIRRLQEATLEAFTLSPQADVSIEVDPRVTSDAQLELLRSLGFNRVSLGVQDFDPSVQQAINRLQPADMTARMLAKCRELGFGGINFDLIYGLPLQSLARFERTVDEIVRMRPDRIALYNYARLPEMLKHQKILEKYPMPEAEERVDIFTMAYDRLTAAGYFAIGMDHFALEDDELYGAIQDGKLYRNFMGYVVKKGTEMLGVGASAIGDLGNGYFQNVKNPAEYEKRVLETGVATLRGCLLTTDDERRKWIIQRLMCEFTLSPKAYRARFDGDLARDFGAALDELEPFVDDGLLAREGDSWKVTPLGRLFVRNIAMVFDAYLDRSKNLYSRTV